MSVTHFFFTVLSVGRTEPNLDDLGLVFHEMGVNLHELADFVKHAESVPFALDVPR